MTLSQGELDRIDELVFGRAEPATGFERHFLCVIHDDAIPHTETERSWCRHALRILIQNRRQAEEGCRWSLEETAQEQETVLSTPGSFQDTDLAQEVWRRSDYLVDEAHGYRMDLEAIADEISELVARLERLSGQATDAEWEVSLAEMREEEYCEEEYFESEL